MLSNAMRKTESVKSIAICKTESVKPISINKELPKTNPSFSIGYEKDIKSPSRDVKCSFDSTQFGTTPPGKNFMANLKLRMQNM